ncbi:MAG: hypothetical protein MRK02_05605 [Candidatus Scalindua sp.]|nr:hypothetical protein [Candidatus Scalindua sp.]
MKKIINGMRYNTETADQIATWNNGRNTDDIGYRFESLYKTKKGNCFLAIEAYDIPKNRNQDESVKWERTSSITAQSHDEALSWLEEHDFDGEIEKHFSEHIEDA